MRGKELKEDHSYFKFSSLEQVSFSNLGRSKIGASEVAGSRFSSSNCSLLNSCLTQNAGMLARLAILQMS